MATAIVNPVATRTPKTLTYSHQPDTFCTIPTRASYNGYYVTFPRLRRGFDSLHPHHLEPWNPSVSLFEPFACEGFFLLPDRA